MGSTQSCLEARLAEFDELRKLAYQHGVRMLPVERIADALYFRDDRLEEFRNVDNPHDVITFDQYAWAQEAEEYQRMGV
jgi:hypothetical protein